MSLDSWKKIYYPTPADSAEAQAAPAAHSLRKWEGLRLVVLNEHGLAKVNSRIEDADAFFVDGDSCALCMAHYTETPSGGFSCGKCPIKIHLGHSCDRGLKPYTKWTIENDPEPMIAALRAAVEIEKAGAK